MTDYERSSFRPLTKLNTIIRPHSPYSEACGPILKEGTVAARIQALHNAQNSQAPRNTEIFSRLQSHSNKVTSPSPGSIGKGDDNHSTYGRRKSLTFAPPASRNASVAGQYYVPPTRYTPQSGVLPGSGAGTSVERVGNKFVLVRAKTLPQHDIPSPWAALPPRLADPEESDGLSPGTKPEERYRVVVPESVEASTEHREVLKKDSVADVLGVMIDKAIYEHDSAIEWSSDGSNPDTHEYRHEALSKQNSSSGSSTPLGSPVRGSTSPDNRSIAATKYSSTSSGSDLSKRDNITAEQLRR
ncbi:MAG: hypothetical protein FRX48_00101 [Lasallia pustulata]|uniref:Uncharacterized protein n=1 Tax=Lasallia pustulata TaxID=136370 RepID=A0A5M8PZV4_9LECA|nr:MAG: hypothetical protein FRX48_00101 [Lasallia pustulata]